MQQQVKPAVMWGTIAVVLLLALGVGFKLLGGGQKKFDRGGSETLMQRVKSGQPMYAPPANAPGWVPGSGQGPGANMPMMMSGPPPGVNGSPGTGMMTGPPMGAPGMNPGGR